MSELNELSMVLIAMMAIIIILILVLGYRKKQKYQESAEKAKQEAQELKAKNKAVPSKNAAKFENGKVIPRENPFGKKATDSAELEDENTPFIAEPEIDPNQRELPFEHEPSISNVEQTVAENAAKKSPTENQSQEKQEEKIPEKHQDKTSRQPYPETLQDLTGMNKKKPSSEPKEPESGDLSAKSESSTDHVLVVDDPGMTGELSENEFPPVYEKPTFGVPEDERSEAQRRAFNTIMDSDKAEPKTFVLIVVAEDEIPVTDIHQFMMANNLKRNYKGHYEMRDNRGNKIFEVVNLLNPGSFPENPRVNDTTLGAVVILDLPTCIPAAAAMHDFIQVTRKMATRINGKVFNDQQHEVSEPYFRSLRDSALGYDSQKVTETV